MYAKIFDVHVASQAGVEQQVPAGVMVIVVNKHSIAVPFPIAAAIQVIRCHNPVRIVVEHDAAGPEIHAPSDEITSYMFIAAVGIRVPRANAVVLSVPIRMRVARIVPAPMIPVVVAVAVLAPVSILAFMLSIVMFIVSAAVIIAVLRWSRNSKRP
jgi:hypothetical protein